MSAKHPLFFQVFHRLERIKGALPDSALLLVMGSVFGGILHFVFPEQVNTNSPNISIFSNQISQQEIYLEPDWFFLYLLPPIALEAGYFMPNKEVPVHPFSFLLLLSHE
jgi:hypothetical protein